MKSKLLISLTLVKSPNILLNVHNFVERNGKLKVGDVVDDANSFCAKLESQDPVARPS